MTEYLEIEDALQVIDRYGFHIRDIGLLASALARPSTTLMGVEAYPQLALKAETLMESVARFHPLIVGNKRTAWMLMVLMLWINGYRHDFGIDEAFNLVVGVEAGDVTLEDSAEAIAFKKTEHQQRWPHLYPAVVPEIARLVVARQMMQVLASSPGMAGVGSGMYPCSADGASVAAVGLSC